MKWIVKLLIIAFPFWSGPLFAQPAPFRMGMEIELFAPRLALIVKYFDFKRLQREYRERPAGPGGRMILPAGDWEALPDLIKARIAIAVSGYTVDSGKIQLKLKDDLPPGVRAVFAPLEWHRDGDAIEFSHIQPAETIGDYERGLFSFARLAGIEAKILDSYASGIFDASYHVHVSGPEAIPDDVYELLNQLVMLKRVSNGETTDLTQIPLYRGAPIYSTVLTDGGVIRILSDRHFELRVHPFPYEEERAILVDVVNDPAGVSRAKLTARIRALLTDEVVTRILENDPLRIAGFLSLLSPAQSTLADRGRAAIKEVLREGSDAQVWYLVRDLWRLGVTDLEILGELPPLAMHPHHDTRRTVDRIFANAMAPRASCERLVGGR